MRIYWTNHFNLGNIGMFARPRGNDWLESEIIKIKQSGITTIVSLLEKDEVLELELEKEAEICKELGLEYIQFPITDRGIPESKLEFKKLVNFLSLKLNKNEKIGIHCRMGIGRTTLLSGAILKKDGMKNEVIFEHLSEKRMLKVPDTKAQKEWVFDL